MKTNQILFVVGFTVLIGVIAGACGTRARQAQASEPSIVMTPTPYSERGMVWVLTIDTKYKIGRYKGSYQHGINGTPSTWTSDNGSLMSTKATVLFESDPAPKPTPSPSK